MSRLIEFDGWATQPGNKLILKFRVAGLGLMSSRIQGHWVRRIILRLNKKAAKRRRA